MLIAFPKTNKGRTDSAHDATDRPGFCRHTGSSMLGGGHLSSGAPSEARNRTKSAKIEEPLCFGGSRRRRSRGCRRMCDWIRWVSCHPRRHGLVLHRPYALVEVGYPIDG